MVFVRGPHPQVCQGAARRDNLMRLDSRTGLEPGLPEGLLQQPRGAPRQRVLRKLGPSVAVAPAQHVVLVHRRPHLHGQPADRPACCTQAALASHPCRHTSRAFPCVSIPVPRRMQPQGRQSGQLGMTTFGSYLASGKVNYSADAEHLAPGGLGREWGVRRQDVTRCCAQHACRRLAGARAGLSRGRAADDAMRGTVQLGKQPDPIMIQSRA